MHKTSIKQILILICLLLSTLLTANDIPINHTSFSGKFVPEKAMKSIFKNFNLKEGTSSWSPKSTCSSKNIYEAESYSNKFFLDNINEDGNESIAKVHSYHIFKANGKEMAYLVIDTQISWCNACKALMSVALWEKTDNRWSISAITKCLVPLGGAGRLTGATKLVKIGDTKYGLLYSQSYNDHELTVLIIEDEKQHLKVVFHKEVGNGNTTGRSSCHNYDTYCWKYTSTISFEKAKKSEFYNLIQRTTGTKYIKDNYEKNIKVVIPYSNVFRYEYKEGKYSKVN
jgi:hypothetical protein